MRPEQWICLDSGDSMFCVDYAMKEQIWEYFKQKKDGVELEDLSGKELCVNFSEIKFVYTSTPDQRRMGYVLYRQGELEKQDMLAEEGLTDFGN